MAPEATTPLGELEREICELAADLAAATCRWLELVAEFDARGGWAEWGVMSCAHWLSWRCGIGLTAAREHTRVGRALVALPLIRAHFRTGELSYSKVRALTRVAQPETEPDLLEIARHATGAQLDRLVREYGGVIRATREHAQLAEEKQQLTCAWGDDGMLHVQGRLTAADGARLLQALEANEPEDPEATLGQRRARALGALAAGTKSAAAEVVVHVDIASLGAETTQDCCGIEGGPPIATETARRLGCDGAIVTMIERDGEPLSVGRRTRAVPPAIRRALRRRDGGCRFPGCTNARFLHAHHIRHWAHGGPTELSNLIQLCSHHHTLVHEGGYAVTLDVAGTAGFFTPEGWEIPPAGPERAASGPWIGEQNRSLGVIVDPDTARPRSAGDRLDYDIAVEGLARRWLPPGGGSPPSG